MPPLSVLDEDGPLEGGTANRGQVVRIGHTVHRPTGPHSGASHAFLRHLTASGFGGAPDLLEVRDGTEVLTYIEGRAATPPLADWAVTDDALVSVGELLRDFHLHASTFDASAHRWHRPVPARWRGRLVTHNDPHPANVIFRNGRAMALIDFDLAAPGSAAWELAMAACFWVPLLDVRDVQDARQGRWALRWRLLLDAYQADAALRTAVRLATPAAHGWIAGIIEEGSQAGHPAFAQLWTQWSARYRRAGRWIRGHLDDLAAAS